MTTMQGYTDGSYDYRQMYDMPDLRGSLPAPVVHEGTPMYALATTPECASFLGCVRRTNMVGVLNSLQHRGTLFIPVSGPEFDVLLAGLSDFECRQLVIRHSLEQPIPPVMIKGTRSGLFNTKQPSTNILVESQHGTTLLNRGSRIVGSLEIGQTYLYLIDRPLCSAPNPLGTISI